MNWISYNTKNIKGKYLFKFLSEKHLTSFLRSGNLWFSRSDQFGDKMECVLIKDLLNEVPDFSIIEKRKKKHLIACFHEGNRETLAFWDTYAKTDEERRKYALRFNKIDLIKRLDDRTSTVVAKLKPKQLVHGKVKYKNLIGSSPEALISKKVEHSAFRKEYAFAYEREYRFDILLTKASTKLGYNLNIGIPSKMSFDILVNPLLTDNDYLSCLDKIEVLGFKKKFMVSSLTKWFKPKLWQ